VRLLRILKKKEKKISQSYNLIYSQTSTNVFMPLQQISKLIKKSNDFVITKYFSNSNKYSLTIEKYEHGDLKKLKAKLKSQLGKSIQIKLLPKSLKITN